MPTLPVLELLEQDLEKPVISSASAIMWQALRLADVGQAIPGYGRLLTPKLQREVARLAPSEEFYFRRAGS